MGYYNLARQLKRRDALIKKLQEDIQSLKLQKKKSSLKKGSESRFFSAEGGLQLAVRHNASLSSSLGFGISAGLDVHGTNITRWQQKLRACQILEFRCWSSSLNAHRAEAVWQQQGLNITLRRFRQDATKSNSWKGKKLSVIELLVSASTKPVLANMSWECVSASVETMCIMADLKLVVGSSTGKSVLGIVDAQVGSVICDPLPWLLDVESPELLALTGAAPLAASQDVAETLVEVVPEAASPEQALVAHGVSPRQSVKADLDVWCCCTDNGPDISCSRNLVASAMALNLWSWWFDIDCLAHQYQLLSLLSLQPTELSELLSLPTSYYSCLAIVMHLLRDNAREVWTFVIDQFGRLRAQELFKHVPPRPIGGRWGNTSKCEDWLIPWTMAELVLVFERVIAKQSFAKQAEEAIRKHEAAAKATAKAGSTGRGRGRGKKRPIDETAADQNEAFSKMWGAWSQKGMVIVKSGGFYILLKMRRLAGKRLDHLLWAIEKTGECH